MHKRRLLLLCFVSSSVLFMWCVTSLYAAVGDDDVGHATYSYYSTTNYRLPNAGKRGGGGVVSSYDSDASEQQQQEQEQQEQQEQQQQQQKQKQQQQQQQQQGAGAISKPHSSNRVMAEKLGTASTDKYTSRKHRRRPFMAADWGDSGKDEEETATESGKKNNSQDTDSAAPGGTRAASMAAVDADYLDDVRSLRRHVDWAATPPTTPLCPRLPQAAPGPYSRTPSGLWVPAGCRPRHVTAVLAPYSDGRRHHAAAFVPHVTRFLRRQQVAYSIYIVEQLSPAIFNRGALLDAGFLAAMADDVSVTCVLFHDVDLLPADVSNTYACGAQPRHLVVAVDNNTHYSPRPTSAGGVLAVRPAVFARVNGFSTSYWGWGGEDDDMYHRLTKAGYSVQRPDAVTGRYSTLPHARDAANPVNPHRLKSYIYNWAEDGLNSLNYSLEVPGPHGVDRAAGLYTHLRVHLGVDAATLRNLHNLFPEVT